MKRFYILLILGLVITITISLSPTPLASEQVKVVFKLYDIDGRTLRLVNGQAKIGPNVCPELNFNVDANATVFTIPAKCVNSSWTLTYYGKNHNGKAFFAVKIFNTTWMNDTTMLIKGRVDIKPLLIRIVSLKDVGLPNAIISLGDGTFTFERVYTNDSGYAWIDLLIRKDIDITVFWPPRTAQGLVPKPQARLLSAELVNYTNYTIKLKYNLSEVNRVNVTNEQGLPGGYTWINVCGKLYYLTFNNTTFNITLKDIVRCKDVDIYYVTHKYVDASYDIIELAEKGILNVRINYIKIYMNRDEALLRLNRSFNNFVDLRVKNNTLFPLYITVWNELYNKWINVTILVTPLKPNTIVWTHRVPLTVSAESDKYGFSHLRIYVKEKPTLSFIEYSSNKGSTWYIVPEYDRKFKAYKDEWLFEYSLTDIKKGVILDVRGFLKFNNTSFLSFYFRDEFPYKKQVFIPTTKIPMSDTSTSTTTTPPTTTTQIVSTTKSTKTTTEPSTITAKNTTSPKTTSTQSAPSKFPWWIIIIALIIILTTILMVKKKR